MWRAAPAAGMIGARRESPSRGAGEGIMRNGTRGLVALAALGLAAAPAGATSLRTRSYDIRGAALNDVMAAMGASGPIGSAGRTEMATRLSYGLVRSPAGYVLDRVELTDSIVQTLPRWVDKAKAAPCLQAQWDGALAALRRHEDGHKRKFMEYRPAVLAALKAMEPQQSPEDVKRRVAEITGRVMGEIDAWQKAYDVRTRHGVAEGVVLRAC